MFILVRRFGDHDLYLQIFREQLCEEELNLVLGNAKAWNQNQWMKDTER